MTFVDGCLRYLNHFINRSKDYVHINPHTTYIGLHLNFKFNINLCEMLQLRFFDLCDSQAVNVEPELEKISSNNKACTTSKF